MRAIMIAIMACALSGVAAPAANAKSVAQEFSEAWAERGTRYTGQAQQAEANLKSAIEQLLKADPSNQEEAKTRISAVYAATQALGYSNGRLHIIIELRTFMQGKPSATRAQLWLQERVQRTQETAAAAATSLTQAQALKVGENGQTFGNVLKAFGLAINAGYFAKGNSEELAMVDQNLTLFYQAKTAQDERRRAARATALSALGQSLQNMAAANQAAMDRNWSATCTRMGNMTHCSGD